MRQRAGVYVLILLSAIVAGCSGGSADRPDPVPVTGVVTHNGSPVEGATVIFQPNGHSHAAAGKTDAAGAFKLTAFEADDGAVPGEYQVAITKTEITAQGEATSDDSPQTVKEKVLLPVKYANAAGSGLVATVKADGENTFEFKLEGDVSKNASLMAPARAPVRTGE